MADNSSIARHIKVRPEWLALHREDIIDPGLPIVDAHHHILDRPGNRYLPDDLLQDLGTGHNIRATVYVQSSGMRYRQDGDPAFAPVGEVAFARDVAVASLARTGGVPHVCAAIVGFADLALGEGVRPVLEAMVDEGGGRFRGIRDSLTWDDLGQLNAPGSESRQGRMGNESFRQGLACLASFGISFDAWVYHTQLDELAELARIRPETQFVLNHMGGVLHIGPYAGRREEMFAQWSAAMGRLAQCPNVVVKLGGIGMNYGGFGFDLNPQPPSSQMLCDAWHPYIETCIDTFGTDRCMFESNFHVDKGTCSYPVVWNAFKRMVQAASTDEKRDLFSATASRVYRIGE